MLSEKQKGELSIFGEVLLSSLFPVITALTVSRLSPLYAAAIGTGLSSIFFAIVLTARHGWSLPTSRVVWRDILLVTFFNGIIFHGLIFIGYKYTTAGNGAVMGLMEVFFTFLIVNLLVKHERFIGIHALGALLMCIGAFFILIPKWNNAMHGGDLLIMLATISAPIGNIFAKKARKRTSAEMLMFIRSIVSSSFLLLLAAILEHSPPLPALLSLWLPLLFTGFLYFGLSKILFTEALHRLSIAKTASLATIGIPLTLFFAWIFLDQHPTPQQIIAIFPMIVGMYLLSRE